MHKAKATCEVGNRAVSPVLCKRIEIQGLVQGVGFRPFVFNLARELALTGFVENSSRGVVIEVAGVPSAVARFITRLRAEHPALARIDHCGISEIPAAHHPAFIIRESDRTGAMQSLVLPDIATCAACLDEINDPANRRYRYPFTNCTHCGPRYSIIDGMPYDRPWTTMAKFAMCTECRREYEDPKDRRFHAQPIACPGCGPHLALWSAAGQVLAQRESALLEAVAALEAGFILALKGLGGFQLLVDARNDQAVLTLRKRKGRKDKPFALMYPGLESIRTACVLTDIHVDLLQSPQAPIVLLEAREGATALAPSVAPGTPRLGIMLPYTPLHHVLLTAFARPLVVTSGNLGDEPICIDEKEALGRLAGIADLFLVHDRPITRQVDDSIVTVVDGGGMVLRRARGYAPLPLSGSTVSEDVLAVGGHLKNSVAFSKGGTIFPSQHIGNLDNMPAMETFQKTIESMKGLLEITPKRVIHDLHPDYASTRFASEQGLPTMAVQHHFAHVLSCMAEHSLEGPVLGISWDGTGYGPDGSIWGGEFLRCTRGEFTRVARLRPFRLPGGDAAVRDPWRSALSLLHEACEGPLELLDGLPTLAAVSRRERDTITTMLTKGINAPQTSSMGRLFDGVASLCGYCQYSTFEGQAAMALERAALRCDTDGFPLILDVDDRDELLSLNWEKMIVRVVRAVLDGVPAGSIAKGFHTALVGAVVQVAEAGGMEEIVLTGGCFQNQLLLEESLVALKESGFRVYRHHTIPPNDGGIAVGQAWFKTEEK